MWIYVAASTQKGGFIAANAKLKSMHHEIAA